MSIAPEIEVHYPAMNISQRAVVSHSDSPLLVIAGPGSGKTFSLVLRALNLLLLGKAKPKELILCTFAEKAAHEIRDRLVGAAAAVGYAGDLSELRVGTIHGICNGVLHDFRHRTPLGNAYETLDDLTELLFLFDHFDEVAGEKACDLYLGRWRYKWAAIRGMRDYFDKITKELVDQWKAQHGNREADKGNRSAEGWQPTPKCS